MKLCVYDQWMMYIPTISRGSDIKTFKEETKKTKIRWKKRRAEVDIGKIRNPSKYL